MNGGGALGRAGCRGRARRPPGTGMWTRTAAEVLDPSGVRRVRGGERPGVALRRRGVVLVSHFSATARATDGEEAFLGGTSRGRCEFLRSECQEHDRFEPVGKTAPPRLASAKTNVLLTAARLRARSPSNEDRALGGEARVYARRPPGSPKALVRMCAKAPRARRGQLPSAPAGNRARQGHGGAGVLFHKYMG